jgi:hypothetical protein
VSEKDEVLKLQKILRSKNMDVIKQELPLVARLVGNSVLIVEGTLPERAVGGTVYIELRRYDHKLLKLTHYK